MEEQRTKKISLKGLDDKHEVTALLAATLLGAMLSPQLLYEGKTERMKQRGVILTSTFFQTGMSNESTVLRYIDKAFNSYLQRSVTNWANPMCIHATEFSMLNPRRPPPKQRRR